MTRSQSLAACDTSRCGGGPDTLSSRERTEPPTAATSSVVACSTLVYANTGTGATAPGNVNVVSAVVTPQDVSSSDSHSEPWTSGRLHDSGDCLKEKGPQRSAPQEQSASHAKPLSM